MNNTDHNPFRENEAYNYGQQNTLNFNNDSPHVTFAARSPSIIPTPIYDDTSSVISSQYTVSSTPQIPPSPLHSMPTITEKDAFEAKVEIENKESSYGPTFREEDMTSQNILSEGSLLTKAYVPPQADDQEEIQLYETPPLPQRQQQQQQQQYYHNNNPRFMPPPEQSRVDIFMSKLKGYQQPVPEEESGISYQNEQTFNRAIAQPPQRGLVYRQLFGNAVYPFFTWITSVIMVGVFIYEIIRNQQLSGTLIQTNPINPMIGPNYAALINMGSKFAPCMTNVPKYPPTFVLGNCYTQSDTCTIESACGFGGFHGETPDQAFRFFTPIFLHAGIVHILMNLITYFQIGIGAERKLGIIRFAVLFIGSGIWGFILSATLLGSFSTSMGCSGALFGLLGYEIIDMIVDWKQLRNPRSQFIKLIIIIIISLALGLLPGLDNFAHIGGLIMGVLISIMIMPRRPFASRSGVLLAWALRAISFVLIIVLYVVFLRIFYNAEDLDNVCPNCKYLSCLPVNGWCDL